MTDIHEAALKQAIRVLVDSASVRIDDLMYRGLNHSYDPETLDEMRRDSESLRLAVDFLKQSEMIGERSNYFAQEFLRAIREKVDG